MEEHRNFSPRATVAQRTLQERVEQRSASACFLPRGFRRCRRRRNSQNMSNIIIILLRALVPEKNHTVCRYLPLRRRLPLASQPHLEQERNQLPSPLQVSDSGRERRRFVKSAINEVKIALPFATNFHSHHHPCFHVRRRSSPPICMQMCLQTAIRTTAAEKHQP